MFASIISTLALVVAVIAKTIPIQVADGGLKFSPNSTTADVGDTLEFHFYTFAAPHSVVEGTFASPCSPDPTSSFFSNYINGTSSGNETYTIAVTSIDPIWYYCSARKHCQAGMVGVVNPLSNMTVDMFAAAAQNASINSAPASTMLSGSYTIESTTVMTSVTTTVSTIPPLTTETSTQTTSTGTRTGAATSTSTGGGALKTAGVMEMMAVGALAALIV